MFLCLLHSSLVVLFIFATMPKLSIFVENDVFWFRLSSFQSRLHSSFVVLFIFVATPKLLSYVEHDLLNVLCLVLLVSFFV